MRNVSEIIIHCSATKVGWLSNRRVEKKIKEIDSWHRAKSWAGIGYHYVIDRDGTVGNGRPVEKTGAHVRGHNRGTIGVCLIGGWDSNENDRFLDNFTKDQDAALTQLLAKLKAVYGSDVKVSGHNEYAAKACPGFRVSEWLAEDVPDSVLTSPVGRPAVSGWLARLLNFLGRK